MPRLPRSMQVDMNSDKLVVIDGVEFPFWISDERPVLVETQANNINLVTLTVLVDGPVTVDMLRRKRLSDEQVAHLQAMADR